MRYYTSGIEYNHDRKVDLIHHPEGYVQLTTTGATNYKYLYYLKDHLGNIRVVFDPALDASERVVQHTDYYPFGMRHKTSKGHSADDHKYLYNGKELQNDSIGGHGLNWYDYGARFYDAEIGRFHTQDRFAENYYSLTPYHYCAGNPINSIDVNGDWVYILHEGEQYRYIDGMLYQYQKEGDNVGKYTAYSAEEGSFLAGVHSALDDLASKTETGNSILVFFSNDDNNAYIKQNVDNENVIDLGVSISTIYLDPNLQGSDIPTERGIQKSPFWLDVGHELAHRKDILQRGDAAKQPWLTNPDTGQSIPITEQYATHKENLMRQQAGLPLRTHYVRQGTGGWEPSRIIDRRGNSKFFPGINYKIKK